MKQISPCGHTQPLAPALLGAAVALCLLAPVVGFAQQSKKGAFIDGEWVEDYVYVPDFMTPQELKKAYRRAFARHRDCRHGCSSDLGRGTYSRRR